MKYFILFLSVLLSEAALCQTGVGPLPSSLPSNTGSDLPALIRKYDSYCSQMVSDTVTQRGKILYDLVPVKNAYGAVMSYVTGSSDTTWEEPQCPEYKYQANTLRLSLAGYLNTRYYSTEFDYGVLPTIDSTGKRQIVGTVTRPYPCQVRLREVDPWSEDFWNWLKKQ